MIKQKWFRFSFSSSLTESTHVFRWLEIANDQVAPKFLIFEWKVATRNDLKGRPQADVQIRDSRVHRRQIRVQVRQIVFPVQNRVFECTTTTGSSAESTATNQIEILLTQRRHWIIPDILSFAFVALLDEHVPMQFCDLVPAHSRLQVQSIDVLTDHVVNVLGSE